MKNLILIASLLFPLCSNAAITVVSDLDDTIKITNSGDPVDAARRAVLSDDVFTGMPEFIKSLKAYVDEVHVLSASPTLLRSKIESTFKKKGITVTSLILKNPLDRQSSQEYKRAALKRLIEKNSGDDFIFIGDDVHEDPEVYDEMKKRYPNRVLASYIHVIKNRDLPKSATKYWTAFDLYLREYKADRMARAEVAMGADRVFGELRLGLIIPGFANCPKTPSVWLWQLPTVFAKDAAALIAKMNIYCTASRSGIE